MVGEQFGQESITMTDELVEALRRKVNAQQARIDDLEDELADLKQVVDPDPGATAYHQLTKDQKVHRVRTALVEDAAGGDGRAYMKYKAVKMLFDGHPSDGHCYDLMERAAHADGFDYDEAGQGDGEKRIRVNLAAVNDDALVHAANNATHSNPV